MKFNRQYIELYRIFTEIILNLDLLAWNILIFLLKYTDKQKVKKYCLEGMNYVKKGRRGMEVRVAGTFSIPCPPNTHQIKYSCKVKGSVMSVLKTADSLLLIREAAPKYLYGTKRKTLKMHFSEWERGGGGGRQVQSNPEAKGINVRSLTYAEMWAGLQTEIQDSP